MTVIVDSRSTSGIKHPHQDASSSLSRPAPTWLRVRRGLHERRAMRLAQSSPMASPRWRTAAAAIALSTSSAHRFRSAELRRHSVARRRAVAAAAFQFATIAKLSVPVSSPTSSPTTEANETTSPARTSATLPAPSVTEPGKTSTTTPSSSSSTTAVPAIEDKNVDPETYLICLLEKRGRGVAKTSSAQAGYSQRPTAKQVHDYDSQPFMSDLVRRGDMAGLQQAVEAGRGMDACNKFGESVVHVACRRGNMDVLRFLLDNGGSLTCCDDLGRFPLHEVCWAAEPRFDIARLFLDEGARSGNRARDTSTASTASSCSTGSTSSEGSMDSADSECGTSSSTPIKTADEDLNLLLVTDKRGCTPLRYVRVDSWPAWRQFLDEIVDHYWPAIV